MQLTEVRLSLCNSGAGRLRAYCSLTFDKSFVIRDVKLIEGHDGLFLAMPSRKLCDRCGRCGEKNHLRARYCNHCGSRLDEGRKARAGGAASRMPLHADIAHPIDPECRAELQRQVLLAYDEEVRRSRQPGYVPHSIDGEDLDVYAGQRGNGDLAHAASTMVH
ncbi:MAG TPA: SpoVG family protein [Tepidisphaeraceae bacterium]|nr:SpoVG family protein [Tepidisphaeraceae bacterium]